MSGATKLRDLQAGTSEIMDSSAMETEEYYNEEGGEWSQKVDTGQLCRVCASPNEYLIPIFDGEGLEHELAMKIQKHLPIKVTETDTLPLHICYQCASTLIAWHDLVISCVEADKKLRELQVEEDDDDEDKGAEMFESHSMDSDPVDEVDQPSTSEAQSQVTKSPAVKKATPNKEKKPKLKMVLVKGPPAGTSGMKTGAKIQVARVLEQAKSKEGGNEESAGERVERDSQSSSNVADVTCGDFKIDIKVENSTDDTHEQVPHKIVSTVKDHKNVAPDMKTCFHCGKPVLSSQLKNDQFVYHCCDETKDPLETNDYKHFSDISQNVVMLQRDKDISDSNLILKAKIVKESFPKVRPTERKDKLHCCSICKKEFSYVLDLTNHAKKEHCPTVLLKDVHKKLQCEHCNLYFATESVLKMHFISAHRNAVELNNAHELSDDPLPEEQITEINAERNSPTTQPVKVPRYLFKSDVKISKEEISNAQVIVNGKKCYQCKICNKLLCSRRALIGHDRIHTGEKPYTCHVCGKQFRSLSEVNGHVNRVHEHIRKYPCGNCGRKFSHSGALREHITVHTGEKPFTCHVCGKQFRLLSQVTRHVNDVHELVKKYDCDICGRKFANRGALRDHTTIHTGERSILCQLCGKSFKTKASLYMHSKFHGENYPYPCLHCERVFRTKAHLNDHIHSHTGERPHECKHCGKSFYTSKYLKNHVLIHTNKNQTYKCSECGKDFAQIRYLKNHERNHRKKAMKQINTEDILISDSSDSN